MPSLQERRGVDVNLRSGPQMREYETIADRIAADRPGRVLDWGCGWGQVRELLERHGYTVRELRRANMLPLTVEHPLARRVAGAVWAANRLLSRVPGLSLLATNVELVATAR